MPRHLWVFNTLSGKKERFVPLTPNTVGMFVCGPTVQSEIHMGHARTYVFYDTVARYLAHLGYRVNYLMNVTDLDERITQAAMESGEDPLSLARRFYDAFLRDMASLRCTSVSRFELVSAHVGTMIQQVAALIDAGVAYASDGWVYFDTSKFRRFGKLSHLSKKELSLRPFELSLAKRHLNDFALWRPEVLVRGRWKSPWGLGTPGWHIQDTAVAISILGSQCDIHGGAYELVYPHHEAQIAEAESLTGAIPFVRYWVHTHHVNMEGRKMSNSTGNVLKVKDALVKFSASELRMFLLGTHYRSDMDLSGMEASSKRLRRLRRLAKAIAGRSRWRRSSQVAGQLSEFEGAMNDDFDTPRAISWIERELQEGASESSRSRREAALAAAVSGAEILGVDLLETGTQA